MAKKTLVFILLCLSFTFIFALDFDLSEENGVYYLGEYKLKDVVFEETSRNVSNTIVSAKLDHDSMNNLSGDLIFQNLKFDQNNQLISWGSTNLEDFNYQGIGINSESFNFTNEGIDFQNPNLDFSSLGGSSSVVDVITLLPSLDFKNFNVQLPELKIGKMILSGSATISNNGILFNSAQLAFIDKPTIFMVNDLLINYDLQIEYCESVNLQSLVINGYDISGEVSFVNNLFTINGSVDMAKIGNGNAAITNLRIDTDGNFVGVESFEVTSIDVNGYLISGSALFVEQGIQLNGNIELAPLNSGYAAISNLVFDEYGDFISCDQISLDNINVSGYLFSGNGSFTENGLLLSGALGLEPIGSGSVSISNLLIDGNGEIVSMDEFDVYDLNIGGYTLNARGVLVQSGIKLSGYIDLAPINSGSAEIRNLYINSQGEIVSVDNFAINEININGYMLNGQAALNKDGLLISGSLGLAPVGSGSVAISNLLLDGSGQVVSMDEFAVNDLNLGGYNINALGVLVQDGIKLSGDIDLAPLNSGSAEIRNLYINSQGEIVSVENFAVNDINLNGYMLNGQAALNKNGLLVSGSLGLAPVGSGSVAISNLLLDGSGQVVSMDEFAVNDLNLGGYNINALGVLVQDGIKLSGDIDLAPLNSGSAEIRNLYINSQGEVISVDNFAVNDINLNGYMLNGQAALNKDGLLVSGSLGLAPIGSGSVAISNLLLDGSGQVVSMDEFAVNDLNLGGYNINALGVLVQDGIKLSGDIDLAPLNSGSAEIRNLYINSQGEIVSVDNFAINEININGYMLNGQAALNKDGLLVSGSLGLAPIGSGNVSIANLLIDGSGQIVSMDEFAVNNLNLGGYNINALGVLVQDGIKLSGDIDLAPINSGSAEIRNLYINSQGEIVSVDNFAINEININGYMLNGQAALNKDGLLVSGSLGLAPIGSGNVAITNLLIDGNGQVVSMNEFALNEINVSGYLISGSAVLNEMGIIISGHIDLAPLNSGYAEFNNLVIDENGEIVGIDNFAVANLNLNGYILSGEASLLEDGIIVSGSLSLGPIGGGIVSINDVVINGEGNLISSGEFAVNQLNVNGFIFSGSVSLSERGVIIGLAQLELTQYNHTTVTVRNIVIDNEGRFVEMENFEVQNLNLGNVVVSGSCTLNDRYLLFNYAMLDLSSFNYGIETISGLKIDYQGNIVSVDSVAIDNFQYGDFALSGMLRLDNSGIAISGEIDLRELGHISVTNLIFTQDGTLISADGMGIGFQIASQFYIEGEANITKEDIFIHGELQIFELNMPEAAEATVHLVKSTGSGFLDSGYELVEAEGIIPQLEVGGYELFGAKVHFDQDGLDSEAMLAIPNVAQLEGQLKVGWEDGFRGFYVAANGMMVPLGSSGLFLTGAGGGLFKYTDAGTYYEVILYGAITEPTQSLVGEVALSVQTNGVVTGIGELDIRNVDFGSAGFQFDWPGQRFVIQAWLGEDPNTGLSYSVFSLKGNLFFKYQWPGNRICGGGMLDLDIWFLASIETHAYYSINNGFPPSEALPRDGLVAGIQMSSWWWGDYVIGGRILANPYEIGLYTSDDWPNYDISWIQIFDGKGRHEGEDNYADRTEENDIAPVYGKIKNYPNPYYYTTSERDEGSIIKFSIPTKQIIELKIYNVKGELVKTLINDELDEGDHLFRWKGSNEMSKKVSSGIYFIKLKGKNISSFKKMTLIK